MAFNPKTEYEVYYEAIPIRDFSDYADEFVVRPPYQRKSVWSRKKSKIYLIAYSADTTFHELSFVKFA